MGGLEAHSPPLSSSVELKIEVVLPEKERGKEELSASGKGSPRAYQGNGTARHFHAEERLPAPHPYPGAQDCVEAAVCHVKDLENGQWVLGLGRVRGPKVGGSHKPRMWWMGWSGGAMARSGAGHCLCGFCWSGPAPYKAGLGRRGLPELVPPLWPDF